MVCKLADCFVNSLTEYLLFVVLHNTFSLDSSELFKYPTRLAVFDTFIYLHSLEIIVDIFELLRSVDTVKMVWV